MGSIFALLRLKERTKSLWGYLREQHRFFMNPFYVSSDNIGHLNPSLSPECFRFVLSYHNVSTECMRNNASMHLGCGIVCIVFGTWVKQTWPWKMWSRNTIITILFLLITSRCYKRLDIYSKTAIYWTHFLEASKIAANVTESQRCQKTKHHQRRFFGCRRLYEEIIPSAGNIIRWVFISIF